MNGALFSPPRKRWQVLSIGLVAGSVFGTSASAGVPAAQPVESASVTGAGASFERLLPGALGSVAGEVRALRDEIARQAHLKRQQIARAIGVDRRSLTSWANGTARPPLRRLEALRFLASLVRDIGHERPGQAGEVLLARRSGGSVLDSIAAGHYDRAAQWRALEAGAAPTRVERRRPSRPALYTAALQALVAEELREPPRAFQVRDDADYEQDPSMARLFVEIDDHRPRRSGV